MHSNPTADVTRLLDNISNNTQFIVLVSGFSGPFNISLKIDVPTPEELSNADVEDLEKSLAEKSAGETTVFGNVDEALSWLKE